MGKKKNTSKAIKGVVREAVEELAPDIYSMPESQQALADAGVSVGHITEIGRASCRERVCQYV